LCSKILSTVLRLISGKNSGAKLTKTKDKLFTHSDVDPALALASVYSLMQHQVGLNHDKVGLFSLRERMELSGRVEETVREQQDLSGISNLIMANEEQEKKRIARELHDGLGQLLTSINLHAQHCLNTSATSDEVTQTIRDSLQVISTMTKQAMGEMRGICCALRPAILDDLGVLAAISWQCRQITQGDGGMKVATDYDINESMIPETYKTVIYRIVQEALNNAVKYADAENLSVSLCRIDGYLQLTIRDNGVGFEEDQVKTGMGMISMRERAESIGGLFEVRSSKGEGVEIRVLLPVEKVALSG
jgi:signal transduction histidine kinase